MQTAHERQCPAGGHSITIADDGIVVSHFTEIGEVCYWSGRNLQGESVDDLKAKEATEEVKRVKAKLAAKRRMSKKRVEAARSSWYDFLNAISDGERVRFAALFEGSVSCMPPNMIFR